MEVNGMLAGGHRTSQLKMHKHQKLSEPLLILFIYLSIAQHTINQTEQFLKL